MTNGPGKSDRPVVLRSPQTKSGNRWRSGMEGRDWPKGTCHSKTRPGHRAGKDAPSALERVRPSSRKDKKFGSRRSCHIYKPGNAAEWPTPLKRKLAGVDGETWRHYGETLEESLQDLSERLKRGAYRAKSRCGRVLIPKGRRAAETARSHGRWKKSCSARGGRGAEHYLRNGFSWIFVTGSDQCEASISAGCSGTTDC